jgi:hypothetical protein
MKTLTLAPTERTLWGPIPFPAHFSSAIPAVAHRGRQMDGKKFASVLFPRLLTDNPGLIDCLKLASIGITGRLTMEPPVEYHNTFASMEPIPFPKDVVGSERLVHAYIETKLNGKKFASVFIPRLLRHTIWRHRLP